MSQIVDQITAEETARLQELVAANVLTRLQATHSSLRDKMALMAEETADLEREITSRTVVPASEEPAQG